MFKVTAITCFLLAFCSGCTQKYAITFESDPYGATLYDSGGRELGNTPITLHYEPTKEAIKSGIVQLEPLKASWVSGATANGPQTFAPSNGSYQTFTFRRPDSFPNKNKDITFAILALDIKSRYYNEMLQTYQQQQQQQQLQQLQQQQELQEQLLKQLRQPSTTRCRSKFVNGNIDTNCW